MWAAIRTLDGERGGGDEQRGEVVGNGQQQQREGNVRRRDETRWQERVSFSGRVVVS